MIPACSGRSASATAVGCGDRPLDDVAHRQPRLALATSLAALIEELIEVEHDPRSSRCDGSKVLAIPATSSPAAYAGPMDEPARPIKRIAVSTGGGDAPGLNAVIRAVVLAGRNRGWDVVGIRDGFNGLMYPERYRDGGIVQLSREAVRGIVHLGGTILGTTNRGNPTAYPVRQPDGTYIEVDRTDELVKLFAIRDIDALVTIGGDGSLTIAQRLHEAGLRVIGVPKTIDNDLDKTVQTFGFDTAVGFASECIDRLFSTATSHGRVIVVEVMGRYAGWIALQSGIAVGRPRHPHPRDPVPPRTGGGDDRPARGARRQVLDRRRRRGRGARGRRRCRRSARRSARPSSSAASGAKVAAGLEELTGKEARTVVLGHLLRGGSPTAFDRLLGLRFGAAAVRGLADGLRRRDGGAQPADRRLRAAGGGDATG